MISPILNEQVNSRLVNIPQRISITQIISYASSLISKPKKLAEYVSTVCFSSFDSTDNIEFEAWFELNSEQIFAPVFRKSNFI